METLRRITRPSDIKNMELEELYLLAENIREAIITKTSIRGGNVASNLAVVEATIALHRIFNTPEDKIIFDTSHYTYAHKILTGRAKAFIEEKHYNDVSNYTAPHESNYDLFELGHTSTSISIALGMAKGRDLQKKDNYIIAFIGEGSLGGGVALEGLQLASKMKKFIIVINDNDQSIADNQGTLYDHLEALRKTRGNDPANIFEEFGYNYIYVDNGNDIGNMIYSLNLAKEYSRIYSKPVVVHIKTIKGFGFSFSEQDPEKWHWHPPYDPQTGAPLNPAPWHCKYEFADYLNALIKNNPNMIVLTAGTPGYIGYDEKHREEIQENFLDVGICEQTAMAMAAGLSKQGCLPIWPVQYTFLQRAYDQLYEEITINNLHVVIVAFECGIYGISAKTHVGLCAIPMLTHIPNLTVLSPTSNEFKNTLDWAIKQGNGPIVIIAPTIKSEISFHNTFDTFDNFKFIDTFVNQAPQPYKVAIIGVGDFFNIAYKTASLLKNQFNIETMLINPIIISELDTDALNELKQCKAIVSIENGSIEGGFGQKIATFLKDNDNTKIIVRGLSKKHMNCYDRNKILLDNRMTPELIAKDIMNIL